MKNIRQEIIAKAKQAIANDDHELYDSPEAWAESIISELECDNELSAQEADEIGSLCEEEFEARQ